MLRAAVATVLWAVGPASAADLIIGDFGGMSTGVAVGTNVLQQNAVSANLDLTDFTAAVNYSNTLANWADRGPVFVDTNGLGSGSVVLQEGQTLSFDHATGPIDNFSLLRFDAAQDVSILGHIVHNTVIPELLHLTISVGGSVRLGANGSFDLNEGALSIEAGGEVEILGSVSARGYDIFADGRIATPDILTSGTVNLIQPSPTGTGLENGIMTGSITATGEIGNNGVQIGANAVRIEGSINAGTLDLSARGASSGEAFVITGDITLVDGDSELRIETDGHVQVDGQIVSQNEHDTIITANEGLQLGNVTVGGNMRLLQPNPTGTGLAGGIQTGSLTLTGTEGHSALEIETSMPVYIDGNVTAGGLNSQPPDLSVDSDFTITGNVSLTEGTFNTLNIESGGDVEIGGEVTGATFFKIQANGGIKTGDVTSNGLIHFEQPDPLGTGTDAGIQTGSLSGAPEGVLFQTGLPVQVSGSIDGGSVVLQSPVSSGTGVGGEPGAIGLVVTGDITVTGSDPSPIVGIGGLSIDTLGSVRIDGNVSSEGDQDIDINASGAIRVGDITGGGNLNVAQYFPTGDGADDGITLGGIRLTGNIPGNNSLQIATPLPVLVNGGITADRVDITPGNGTGHAGVTINGDIELGDGQITVNYAGVLQIGGAVNAREVTVYDDASGSSFESGAITATERVEISVGGDIIVHGGISASDGEIRMNVGPFGNAFTDEITSLTAAGDLLARHKISLNHQNVDITGSVMVTSDDPESPLDPAGFFSSSPTGDGTFALSGNLHVQRGTVQIEHQDGITIDGSATSANGELNLQSYFGSIQTGDLHAGSQVQISGGDQATTVGNVFSGALFTLSTASNVTIGNVDAPQGAAFTSNDDTALLATGDIDSSGELEFQGFRNLSLGSVTTTSQIRFSTDPGSLHITADLLRAHEIVFDGPNDIALHAPIETEQTFYAEADSFVSQSISSQTGVSIIALNNITVAGSLTVNGAGSVYIASTLNNQSPSLDLQGAIDAPDSYVEIYVGGQVELPSISAMDVYLSGGAEYRLKTGATLASPRLVVDYGSSLHAGDSPLGSEVVQISSAELFARQLGVQGAMIDFQNGTSLNPEGAAGPGAIGLNIEGDVNWYTEAGYLNLDLVDADGIAGSPAGWDALFISGGLNLDPAGGALTIRMTTLDPTNNPGDAFFDAARNYSWMLINADGGISGFDPAWVELNLDGFSNVYDGAFALQLDPSGTALNLTYTSAIPEPGSVRAFVLGAAFLARRRSRRSLSSFLRR